jgi:hypothetical protein
VNGTALNAVHFERAFNPPHMIARFSKMAFKAFPQTQRCKITLDQQAPSRHVTR